MLCCQQKGNGIVVKCDFFRCKVWIWDFLYYCTFPLAPSFYFFLQCLLLRKANRVDSSVLAGFPGGVIRCDDLSVSTWSQFATVWLKNTCHQVIQVLMAVWPQGRTTLRFPCALEEKFPANCNRRTAVSLMGSWHQWTHAPRCEGAEVWSPKKDLPSLKEGISLQWNCIPHCDSIMIFGGGYKLGGFFTVTNLPD